MAYTTLDKVAAITGFESFSTTTRPTQTQVTDMINDVTGEMDFVLSSKGITTPITNSNLLRKLDIICKYGVACQVLISGYGNADSVDGSQGDKFCEKYKEYLQDIKDNPEDYGYITGNSTMFIGNQVSDGTYTESEITDRYMANNYEV